MTSEEKIYFEKERKTLESFLAHIAELVDRAGLIPRAEDGKIPTISDRHALQELKNRVEEALKTETDEDKIALLKHIRRHADYGSYGTVKKKTKNETIEEPKPKQRKRKGKKAETEAVVTPPQPPEVATNAV